MNTYDGAERLQQVNGSYNGAAKGYVTSATYARHGEPWTVWLGNNLVQRTSYNSRLQIATWRAAYQDQDSNQYLVNVLNYGTANNGNVQSVTESLRRFSANFQRSITNLRVLLYSRWYWGESLW